MSYLLDTNAISEWIKARPNAGLAGWLAEVDEDRVFVSVITLAELRYGIERMAAGARRRRLDQWLREELAVRFDGRVLLVDATVADAWGGVVARQESRGRGIGAMDAFLAATADVHDLTLVTRNTTDFEGAVKSMINPWTEE